MESISGLLAVKRNIFEVCVQRVHTSPLAGRASAFAELSKQRVPTTPAHVNVTKVLDSTHFRRSLWPLLWPLCAFDEFSVMKDLGLLHPPLDNLVGAGLRPARELASQRRHLGGEFGFAF